MTKKMGRVRLEHELKAGDVVGKWTVVEYLHDENKYRARCSCGTVAIIQKRTLERCLTTQCFTCSLISNTKWPVRPKGYRFGAWTIIRPVYQTDSKGFTRPAYEVRCLCGRPGVVQTSTLELRRSTQCRSCACSQARRAKVRSK